MARRYVDEIVLLDDPTILGGLRFRLRTAQAGGRAGRRRGAGRRPRRAGRDPGRRAGRGPAVRWERRGRPAGALLVAAGQPARGHRVTDDAGHSRPRHRRRRHRRPRPAAPPLPPTAPATPVAGRRRRTRPADPSSRRGRLLGRSFDLLGAVRHRCAGRRSTSAASSSARSVPLALASWGLLVVEMDRGFVDFESGFASNSVILLGGGPRPSRLIVAVGRVPDPGQTVLGGRMADRPVSAAGPWPGRARVLAGVVASFIAASRSASRRPSSSSVAPSSSRRSRRRRHHHDRHRVIGGAVRLRPGRRRARRRRPVRGDPPVVPRLPAHASSRPSIVVVFETVAFLLVVLGLRAGLDLVLRLFEASASGPRPGRPASPLTRSASWACSRSGRCSSR